MSAAAARAGGPRPIPRPLIWLGVPLAALLLTSLFVFLGFPYERVRESLAAQIGAASGARVEIARLRPGLSLLGPALVAEDIAATLADGSRWEVERARLRPAWSLAWLRGGAALAIDVAAPLGRARGTLYAGGEPGFDGELSEVALARLPLAALVADLALDGTAQADVDLRATPGGPRGSVALRARSGSLGLPGLPVALPFETLETELELGDAVQVRTLSLDGPMLSLHGEGRLGPGTPLSQAPLDVQLSLEVREASLRPMLQSLGVRPGADGKAELRLAGSAARPLVRPAR